MLLTRYCTIKRIVRTFHVVHGLQNYQRSKLEIKDKSNILIKPLLSMDSLSSALLEQKQIICFQNGQNLPQNGPKLAPNCCIFLYFNFPKFPGIGKNFPRMTFMEFPGNFPVGKSPGNITSSDSKSLTRDHNIQ